MNWHLPKDKDPYELQVDAKGLEALLKKTVKGEVRFDDGSRALYAAFEAGRPVDVEVSGIAADSLGARRIGAIAWSLTQRSLAASHLIADDAIRAAQQALWRELRLAVEPAAALPLAALTTRTVVPRAGEKVLLVVCGANVDPASIAA